MGACRCSGSHCADFRLYVDGFTSGNIGNSSNPSSTTINAFNGLIDELYIYNAALSDSQIRALAGREYLDLSGNKRHIVPFGDDFDMSSPYNGGSDDNVRFQTLPIIESVAWR